MSTEHQEMIGYVCLMDLGSLVFELLVHRYRLVWCFSQAGIQAIQVQAQRMLTFTIRSLALGLHFLQALGRLDDILRQFRCHLVWFFSLGVMLVSVWHGFTSKAFKLFCSLIFRVACFSCTACLLCFLSALTCD
jgi:hypothetical protein